MLNLFERAAREKLRFSTPIGPLSAEQLFDLPLQSETGKANLDSIAQGIDRQLSQATRSFVDPGQGTANAGLVFALDVVKRVIEIKVAESSARAAERKKAEDKQKIMALIADKKDEALKGKSLAELEGLLAAL